MTVRFFSVFAVAAFLMISVPAFAQQEKPSTSAPHIFAFPGTECPVASRPYAGPENDAAMAQGVIYCVFARTATRVAKADFDGQCPPDMKMAKDDGEFIWCSLPQDVIFDARKIVNYGTPKDPSIKTSPQLSELMDEARSAGGAVSAPAAPAPAADAPVAKPSLGARFKAWLGNILP